MRLNERSLVVMIGGGLVFLAAIAVVLFLLLGGGDDDGSTDSFDTGSNAARTFEGGPDEVLYLSGTALVRRNIEDAEDEPAGTIESPSVYASPGSQWIAYVTSKIGEDFAAEPSLRLYDPESDRTEKLGPGVAPVWNASGSHVAFLRPVEARECQGEECTGDVQVAVVDVATGVDTLLLDPGRYTILGWAGEWVMVSNFDDPATVTAVDLQNQPEVLDMPASQFWDASPDGRWVVKTNAKKTEFVPFSDGALGEDRVAVPLEDYRLLEGGWAHDSSRVAAVVALEEESKKGKVAESTRIVTFSPEDPELALVERTFGATGTVMWSVDNDSIVFTTLLDPKRALFQAQQCSLGNQSGCEIVTSWTEGVALLRTE